jgi:hypothetical protein
MSRQTRHSPSMDNEHNEYRFSFRWGIPILDAARCFTPIYDFMLHNYRRLSGRYVRSHKNHTEGDEWHGVSRQEFLVIIHLAARHFETERGQSSPSLRTIAREMGISWRGLQKLIYSLEAKGMMKVARRPGSTSIYNCSPFAMACYELWQQTQEEVEAENTHEPQFVPTHEPQFVTPTNPSSSETKNKRRKTQQHAPDGANVVVSFSQSQKGERVLPANADTAFRLLIQLGMTENVARRLSADNDALHVIAVARAARDKDSPAGWARKALEEGWAVQDPDKANEDELRDKAKDCARGRGDICPIFEIGVCPPECAFCRLGTGGPVAT